MRDHMNALTPFTSITGFKTALAECLDPKHRNETRVFYWGFSTGGGYMWALAKSLPPDGMLGFGMNNFAFSAYWASATNGKYEWLYDRSTSRVRERGMTDFTFYTRDLSDQEREKLWQVALHSPRFKSHEDTFMFFNAAALSQGLSELWKSPSLPDSIRTRGFAELFRENFDLAFADHSIGKLNVLEFFGDGDEILPFPVSSGVSAAMTRPFCRRYILAVLEGRHHSIDADHAEAFGSLWLDAIEAGYFK